MSGSYGDHCVHVITCSTSNLSPSEQHERRMSDQNSARLKTKVTSLEKQVEESRKENQHLQSKVRLLVVVTTSQ